MEDDEKIVRLQVPNRRADESELFLVKKPKSYQCRHSYFEIDEEAGKCTCKQCGEEFTPIAVLLRLAQTESRWLRNRERYIDEMARLAKRQRVKCGHCGKITKIR